MLDVQRERLKHMLANAILELWKKETGSLSPVIIEGTICITAGSGRTTVVQVASHFSGAIPEGLDDNNGPTYNTPKRKMLSLRSPFNYGSGGEMFSSPQLVSPYPDDVSPGSSLVSPASSLVSPHSASVMGLRTPVFNPSRRTMRKSNASEQSMDISNIKEENASDDEDNNGNARDEEDNSQAEESAINVSSGSLPGTGFYVQDGQEREDGEDSRDSDIDVTNNDSIDETSNAASRLDKGPMMSTPLMSTPKPRSSSIEHTPPSEGDALDLSSSHREDDLALSPPQNYTAQVRNVIRQRLLASRQNSAENARDMGEGARESRPVSRHEEVEPKMSSSSSLSSSSLSSSSLSLLSSSSLPTTPSTSQHEMRVGVGGGVSPLPPLMNLNLNSPSMLPLQYGGMIPPHSKAMGPAGPIHDILSASRPPLVSPDLYRPPSQGSFDQNGNNKDTLYINDKGESQKVYRCNFCSKTFLFKSKYYEHLPVHTNVRPFQCHLCSRTYKYKYDLRVHLRTHMGIPTKSTVCPFCSVKFDTNKMLRLHIQDFHRGHVVSDQNMMSPTDGSPTEPLDQQDEVNAST